MSERPPAIIPAGPFPGSPGAPTVDPTAARGFVVGGYAECYLFGAVVANLFDWKLKATFDYSNLTAHGDYWQVNVFLDGGWTASAKGYLTLLGSTYLAPGASPTHALTAATLIPQAITFVGYANIGAAAGGKILWQGTCGVKDFELLVPEALVTQEISLIGTGVPTTIS